MSTVGVAFGAGATGLGVIGSIFAQIAQAFVNILLWTVVFILAIFDALLAFGQNKRTAALVILALAASFVVGPPAVSDINIVWRPIDFTTEAFVRPVFEIVSKAAFVQFISVYDTLSPFFNTIWFYVTERIELWWMDVSDLYDIIMATGDYLRALKIIKSTWTLASSILFYFWDTKSAGGKVEFFPEKPVGAHFFPFTAIHMAPTYFKFETDPRYGAFPREDIDNDVDGGASEGAIPYDVLNAPDPTGASYYVRNIIFDIINIAQRIGDVTFDLISQFSAPGQELFFNLTTRVGEAAESTWRKVADVFTVVFSFIGGSSFYSKDSDVSDFHNNSVQSTRFNHEKYIARSLRILASAIRFISLVTIHSSTVHYPVSTGSPVGTGIEYLKFKLFGVPGIDMILDPDFTSNHTVIILRKHEIPCVVLQTEHIGGAEYGTLAFSNFARHVSFQCNAIVGGMFSDVLPISGPFKFGCLLWDGVTIPTEDRRIDYVFELFSLVPDIIQLIQDPSGVQTSYATNALETYKSIYKPFLVAFYGLIKFINAHIPQFSDCNIDVSAVTFLLLVNRAIYSSLDFLYAPYSCEHYIEAAYSFNGTFVKDPLTCFIALQSQSTHGAFPWAQLCGVLNIFGDVVEIENAGFPPVFPPFKNVYQCTTKRKRREASSEFGAAPTLSWRARADLHAMRLASDTRNAFTALDSCVFSGNATCRACSSMGCAIAPCIDESFNCIVSALPQMNIWHGMLSTNNNTRVSTRNIVSTALHFADFLRGCSDSSIMKVYRTLTKVVTTVRSMFSRWLIVSTDYVPAFFQCMDKLRALPAATSHERDNLEFAHCLGLVPRAENATHLSWEQILNSHEIYANSSWCARSLHKRGVVIDDPAHEESLSLDHLVYRFCLFEFSYGARAVLSRTTRRRLPEFLDGWTFLPALLESVDRYAAHPLTEFAEGIPDKLPRLTIIEKEGNETEDARARVVGVTKALGLLMPYADVAASFFHYYADRHDLIATKESSVEEKAALDRDLFRHHMGLKRTMDSDNRARQPTAEETMQAAATSERFETLETRKRNFANSVATADSHITVLQQYGRLLYWAGNYSIATALNEQQEWPFEFTIDPKWQDQQPDPHAIVSMRPRKYDAQTGLLQSRSESTVPWTNLQIDGFDTLLTALTLNLDANAQQKQLLASATAAYRSMRSALVPRETFVQGGAQLQSAYATINFGSVLITSLWRIFNRRGRIEGFPAFHTAMLYMSVLSGDETHLAKVPAWLNGQLSFIPELGFVDNDVYAEYIANEQEQRKRALFLPTYYSHSPLYSLKRARLAHAQNLLNYKQKETLLGLEPLKRSVFYERQQRSVVAKVLKRHTTFADRSAFLLRHDMHEDDENLHLIAPEWWRKREMPTLANTTESRRRYTVAASFQSGNFLAGIDQVLHTLGAKPNTLETALVQLEVKAVHFFSAADDPLFFENLQIGISNYFLSMACDFAINVAATGPGPYKLLCFPNLPENGFAWYKYFPEERGLPLLGFFQDAGYWKWPTPMILHDCPSKRIPILQWPPPRPLFTQHQTSITYSSDSFASVNGQSAPVYPVYTHSVRQNINVTDWCVMPHSNDFGERPGCPLYDYCTRTYYSPSHFGFTNGGVNLIVWLNDFRYVYSVAITNDARLPTRLWSILFLFLVLAFGDFFGYFWSYLIVIVMLIAQTFISLTPENWAYALVYFWFWLEVFPLLAWLQWTPFILHHILLRYYNVSFLTPFFAAVPNWFLDTLLVRFLNWLATITSPTIFGVTITIPFLSPAVLTGYANAILAAQVAFPGTELNNVMAVASFWNVELLVFEFIGIALAIVYFGGVFLYFVSAFLPILPLLGTIAGSTSSVLVTLGLLRSVESIEDLHTETTSRSARLAMETRTALENLKRKTEALSARFGEAAKRK